MSDIKNIEHQNRIQARDAFTAEHLRPEDGVIHQVTLRQSKTPPFGWYVEARVENDTDIKLVPKSYQGYPVVTLVSAMAHTLLRPVQ